MTQVAVPGSLELATIAAPWVLVGLAVLVGRRLLLRALTRHRAPTARDPNPD